MAKVDIISPHFGQRLIHILAKMSSWAVQTRINIVDHNTRTKWFLREKIGFRKSVSEPSNVCCITLVFLFDWVPFLELRLSHLIFSSSLSVTWTPVIVASINPMPGAKDNGYSARYHRIHLNYYLALRILFNLFGYNIRMWTKRSRVFWKVCVVWKDGVVFPCWSCIRCSWSFRLRVSKDFPWASRIAVHFCSLGAVLCVLVPLLATTHSFPEAASFFSFQAASYMHVVFPSSGHVSLGRSNCADKVY